MTDDGFFVQRGPRDWQGADKRFATFDYAERYASRLVAKGMSSVAIRDKRGRCIARVNRDALDRIWTAVFDTRLA